jgi:hypothetical protein
VNGIDDDGDGAVDEDPEDDQALRGASEGKIRLYDPDLQKVAEWAIPSLLCVEHGSNDGLTTSTDGLQHSVLVKVPVALMDKAGDYRFVISAKDSHADREKGHRQKGALERNQQTAYVDIAKVEWLGYNPGDGKTNYEKGTNPANKGGGDRIFAERNQPMGRSGDQFHDKIRILVTLKSAPRTGTQVTIFFRLFDPDHYSNDVNFDPNDIERTDGSVEIKPNDNVQAGGNPVIGAKLKKSDFSADATSVTLVGDGVTKSVMMGLEITARQPCNNFKVMAHWSQEYLNSVVFASDGKTLKEGRPNGLNIVKELQTELLTVWRTLYVERDSMAAPIYTQGPAPSRIESGNITGLASMFTIITDVTILAKPGVANQFKGGRIELLTADDMSLGIFNVDGNTTGSNSRVTLTVAVPQSAAKFKNLEDDDIAHGVTAAEMQINNDTTSLWASRYEPACVKVDLTKTDLSPLNTDNVNSNNVTFETNIGTEGTLEDAMAKVKAKVRANKQSMSSSDFWVIYQLGAFQQSVYRDTDPNDEYGQGGVSSIYSDARDDAEAGTMLFRETQRDAKLAGLLVSETNLWRLASVHESGHEFGLFDGDVDGPLMNDSNIRAAVTQAQVDALVFSGEGLKKITRKSFPGSRYN